MYMYMYIYIRSDMRCTGLSSLRALGHVFAPLSASTLDPESCFLALKERQSERNASCNQLENVPRNTTSSLHLRQSW
jgi:hypothetical protein